MPPTFTLVELLLHVAAALCLSRAVSRFFLKISFSDLPRSLWSARAPLVASPGRRCAAAPAAPAAHQLPAMALAVRFLPGPGMAYPCWRDAVSACAGGDA